MGRDIIKHKLYKKLWYIRTKDLHKNRYKINNKNNKEDNKLWFKEHKKDKICLFCSENHHSCLEYHHLNPNEKEYNISRLVGGGYKISKIEEEIKKCILVCANCHRKIHDNIITIL